MSNALKDEVATLKDEVATLKGEVATLKDKNLCVLWEERIGSLSAACKDILATPCGCGGGGCRLDD